MPGGLRRVHRAAPSGALPPLGQLQDNSSPYRSASRRRLGPRVCLRKGCDESFQPRCWRQRYCQQPECLREVRRWQAAKRQQQRRRRPEVRQEQAAAQRARRARRREEGRQAPGRSRPSGADAWGADGALSRKKKTPAPFCDRVGCYEPRRSCPSDQARYCGDGCRRAIRRVRDRERKWLLRKTPAGRFKRRLEYQVQRAARAAQRATGTADSSRIRLRTMGSRSATIGISSRLGYPVTINRKEVIDEDQETRADRGPRAPPSS